MTLTYSKKLMKHFKNPKFVKKIKNPDAVGEVGNIRCGDVMHLEIKVKGNRIEDIGFQTFGCPAAVASSDVVCKLAKGKTLNEAKKITKDSVVKELGGMPPVKLHCSVLGIQALKKAILDYEKKIKYFITSPKHGQSKAIENWEKKEIKFHNIYKAKLEH